MTPADIEAANVTFDRGDTNAADTLDMIAAAIRDYRAVLEPGRVTPAAARLRRRA